MILSVEPSGTLALTQQMDKFHDLGTPNHIQSHNQAFTPNSNQYTLSRATETGIQNGTDHAMNPFASPSMYVGASHGQNNASHSTSSSMLPPANISPNAGASAGYQLQNTALSASPSSSFSNPHLLMRRPSSPTDSDQPVVSARNILARKISESPIDRNATSVLCNGDSTFMASSQNNMNINSPENPSNGVIYQNKYEDEEMD